MSAARTAPPAAPEKAAAPAVDARYPWYVLAVTSLNAFSGVVDQASINVNFPLLVAAFDVSVAVVGWVTVAHTIALVTCLTIFGRLADLVGGTRIFVAGMVVYLAGLLLAGTAQGLGWLIAGRVVTGLGMSMSTANSIGLIGAAFPSHRRGLAIGILEATVAVGMAVGPLVGGYLADRFGWRAIFFFGWPFVLLNAALAIAFLRDPPRREPRESFDIPGAATFAGGTASFLFGLTHGPSLGWGSPWVLGALGLGGALLAAFLLVEQRVRHPMISLALFRHPVFAAANAAKIACYLSLMAAMFVTPFYAQRALGLPLTQIGLVMLPFAIGHAIGSLAMGPLSDRVGSRVIAPAGLATAAVGSLLLSRIGPADGVAALLLILLVLVLGLSSFITPNDSAIVAAAPRDRLGVAGGILAMTRSLGMMVGLALAGTVLAAREPAHAAAGLDATAAFVAAYHDVFLLTAAACALGTLLSLVGSGRRG